MLLKRMARSGTVRDDLTGFILAGGASRRMGRDKAQISWGGSTLLNHAIENLKHVTSEVFVVGAVSTDKLPVPVLPDKLPGAGPLAGIQAALNHSKTNWNFILAVDLPLVTPQMLDWIAAFQADASRIAIVPRVKSRLQPICAVYHRNLLPEINAALGQQQSSIHRLLERLSTRIIEEDELIASGFAPEMFLNVNTPEDLERARAIAKSMHG
jgi:molybdopterin-guanine dinucleotide biosynthesis protein A